MSVPDGESKTEPVTSKEIDNWIESDKNTLHIVLKKFALGSDEIDFEIASLASSSQDIAEDDDWGSADDLDLLDGGGEEGDDDDDDGGGWDEEEEKADVFAFSISSAPPHFLTVHSDIFDGLETEAVQYCFGDKTRSVHEILNFVTKFIVASQEEQDAAWGDASVDEFSIPDTDDIHLKRSHSYIVLCREEIETSQRTMINRVAGELEVTASSAGTLLRHFRWDPDKLIRDYNPAVAEKAGVAATLKSIFSPPTNPEEEMTCQVCFSDIKCKNSFSLACNHRFCTDCWRHHLESAVKDGTASGSNVLFLRCPGFKCKTVVGEEVFQMLLGRNMFKKFHSRLVQSFVDDNDSASWCPTPNCDYVIAFSKRRKTVLCRCGHEFCFRCSSTAHAPTSCQEYQSWTERDKGSQSLDTKYLLDQTKACPNCGVRTKKEGGCMYIQCSQCNKPWCWQCGQSDHHVWECNRPKYGNKKGDEDPDDLNRYLFYYERFFNHTQSLTFAEKQEADAQKKMEQLVAQGVPYRDVEFLLKAVRLVKQCREVLRYTYAHAYFIKEQQKREFFEFRQRQLEDYTEKISQMTEQALAELVKGRLSVLDWTKAVNTYLETIIYQGSNMEGTKNGV